MSSLFVIDITSSVCPDSNLLKPCYCITDSFYCDGEEDIDLVQIFQTLSKNLTKTEKHFKYFQLNNRFITELKENTFSDITFDGIIIQKCLKLQTIDKNAFNTTDSLTTKLHIIMNRLLTSPNNSIFEVLSKFVQATTISLVYNNITEIPSNAFRNIVGKQDHLREIDIAGASIRKLGNNVFSQLKNLENFFIMDTSIDFIPENAFEFNEEHKCQTSINLYNNRLLNISGFSQNSLSKLKRPTSIVLDSSNANNFPYLAEKIFQPFFLSNAKNQIEILRGALDCSDCRNYWLKKNPNLLKQIKHSKCSNGKSLNDTTNFKNCSD